jgi:hypothetical protein
VGALHRPGHPPCDFAHTSTAKYLLVNIYRVHLGSRRGVYMSNKNLWKIIIAEIGYFSFILLGIYAGYRFWKVTMFSTIGENSIYGTLFSFSMLILIILAMIPTFLLSLRRVLLKWDVLTKDEYRRYLWSRTWFVDR